MRQIQKGFPNRTIFVQLTRGGFIFAVRNGSGPRALTPVGVIFDEQSTGTDGVKSNDSEGGPGDFLTNVKAGVIDFWNRIPGMLSDRRTFIGGAEVVGSGLLTIFGTLEDVAAVGSAVSSVADGPVGVAGECSR